MNNKCKFKKGDKVVVHQYLENSSEITWCPPWDQLMEHGVVGTVAEAKTHRSGNYCIVNFEQYGGEWAMGEDILSLKEDEPKFKVGDKVVVYKKDLKMSTSWVPACEACFDSGEICEISARYHSDHHGHYYSVENKAGESRQFNEHVLRFADKSDIEIKKVVKQPKFKVGDWVNHVSAPDGDPFEIRSILISTGNPIYYFVDRSGGIIESGLKLTSLVKPAVEYWSENKDHFLSKRSERFEYMHPEWNYLKVTRTGDKINKVEVL